MKSIDNRAKKQNGFMDEGEIICSSPPPIPETHKLPTENFINGLHLKKAPEVKNPNKKLKIITSKPAILFWFIGTIASLLVSDAYGVAKNFLFEGFSIHPEKLPAVKYEHKPVKNDLKIKDKFVESLVPEKSVEEKLSELSLYALNEFDNSIFDIRSFYNQDKSNPKQFILAMNRDSVLYKFYFAVNNGKETSRVYSTKIYNPYDLSGNINFIESEYSSRVEPKSQESIEKLTSKSYQRHIMNFFTRRELNEGYRLGVPARK